MEPHLSAEGPPQCKSCRLAEADGNVWAARASESEDKLAHKCSNCQALKSGPLFISSKGIGWTSWKKRWFILTRTSLMFFRSDPSAATQKGNEGNLTLGGIELNNSGSVVVKADKKLLTVLFPDGRDGRAFTLKAETSEDLYEWKTALENALAQAPSAALVMGQSSIFRNDAADAIESALGQGKDEEPIKSSIIGRPALFALKDADGNPSFLEKALRFIEQYGFKIEGILRQSADVEEVKRRFEEYEQGKNEFTVDEDAHLIADCIKYVLREMPLSPVPAACCAALLEAFRGDRGARVSRMYRVISETFPEPNQLLLKRILAMMRVVASHKSENRMSISAVAACMAPLLLRPLLAGDCELDEDFNMGGDGSLQLLQAAAAANHAQAMVIILIEEYEKIFSGDYVQEDSSSEVYSDSDDAYDEDEEEEDGYEYEDSTENEGEEDDGYHDTQKDTDAESDDVSGQTSSRSSIKSSEVDDGSCNKENDGHDAMKASTQVCEKDEYDNKLPNSPHKLPLKCSVDESLCENRNAVPQKSLHGSKEMFEENNYSSIGEACELYNHKPSDVPASSLVPVTEALLSCPVQTDASIEPASSTKRRTIWGRTPAKKNLSVESIEYVSEEEAAIQTLETAKLDLQSKLTEEVKENERLQASLERRKQVLRDRRMALQMDVERLQEQLQRERNLRASLEAGLLNTEHGMPLSSVLDKKIRADLEEIALAEEDVSKLNEKVADLRDQLKFNQKDAQEPCEISGQYHSPIKGKEYLENVVPSTGHHSTSQRKRDALLEAPSRNEVFHVPDMPSLPQPPEELQHPPSRKNAKSTEQPCLLKADAISTASSKREHISSGLTSKDEQTQLQSLKSKQSRQPSHKQSHQLISQHVTKDGGACSNVLMESSSTAAAKLVSQSSGHGENVLPSGTTSKHDSPQPNDSSVPDKPNKQKYPLLTSEKNSSMGTSGDSVEESCISGGNPASYNSEKRENLLAGAAPRINKPQAQDLASSQPQIGQPPLKLTEKAMNQDNEKAKLNIISNEKASISRPDALPQKLNNPVLGTNFDSVKMQQIPGSPPLRRRQPTTRKTNSRMVNPGTTVSLSSSTNNLPPEDAATGAVSSSKRTATRVEEAVSSTSALTRLSNRLNFLKEKRVQLANELQAMDLGQAKTSESAPSTRTDSR